MYQHQNVSTSSDFKNYQAVASSILAGCPQVPVIAVDLDYTVSNFDSIINPIVIIFFF